MSSKVSIISPGMRGVEMLSNEFFVARSKKFIDSINFSFEEGSNRTRYPFIYKDLKLKGKLQDAVTVNLGRGLSRGVFAYDREILVVVIGGRAYWLAEEIDYSGGHRHVEFCEPKRICDLEWDCNENVRVKQVESYVVFYGENIKTQWWDGEVCKTSPGMEDRCAGVQDEKGYEPESFCREKIRNWIPHNICELEYIHGRIHALVDGQIIVGDLLHKRGENTDEDVFLFNEAAHDSFGDPLGIPSRLAPYIKLLPYPKMGTAYGEGDLIGYAYGGIVSHDTYKFPRQTRYSGEGELLQKGWAYERMVSHITNSVTAVGRNSVVQTPRNHFFASSHGLHLLSQVAGEGDFNTETVNSLAHDIDPLIKLDPEPLLHGRAVGYWMRGNRYLSTVGLFESKYSVLPMAKGFVSHNHAASFSEDQSPFTQWEGLMVPDEGIEGIHFFLSTKVRQAHGTYGFLASDKEGNLYFAELAEDRDHSRDVRDGVEIPIKGEITTARHVDRGMQRNTIIDNGRLHFISDNPLTKVEVELRTSNNPCWQKWRTAQSCDKGSCYSFKGEPLGIPPEGYREALWHQTRIKASDYVEIESLEYGIKVGEEEKDKEVCKSADPDGRDWEKTLCLPNPRFMYIFCNKCNLEIERGEACSCANEKA